MSKFICNKCGYCGDEQIHVGCEYFAAPTFSSQIESLRAELAAEREKVRELEESVEFMSACVIAACEDRKYFEEQAADRHRQFNRAQSLSQQLAAAQEGKQ